MRIVSVAESNKKAFDNIKFRIIAEKVPNVHFANMKKSTATNGTYKRNIPSRQRYIIRINETPNIKKNIKSMKGFCLAFLITVLVFKLKIIPLRLSFEDSNIILIGQTNIFLKYERTKLMDLYVEPYNIPSVLDKMSEYIISSFVK